MGASTKRSGGFTLTELVVAIGIFAVLATVAAPTFRSYTAAQSIRTASFNLTFALMLARSEAIKRNRTVTVAPVDEHWEKGWVITAAGSAAQLHAAGPLKSSVVFGSDAPELIAFQPTGRVASIGTVYLPLSVERGSDTLHRCISLDPSGMPKSVEVSCP
jgi:type IV fimbrial biogenesis protein FimT